MMTAQCLPVPMVGEVVGEVYNSHKFWILEIHVYFQSVTAKQKGTQDATRRSGAVVQLF